MKFIRGGRQAEITERGPGYNMHKSHKKKKKGKDKMIQTTRFDSIRSPEGVSKFIFPVDSPRV